MKVIRMKENLFELPECIKKLEIEDDITQLPAVQNLFEQFESTTADWYIQKNHTLLHLEEAAELKRLTRCNYEKTHLTLRSRTDKTFFIQEYKKEVMQT